MGDGPLLDRGSIEQLLREVSDELAAKGVRGRMFVVGGAAIALAFGRERTTQDVDAVFEPKDVIYAAARLVAARHGLADDWLNDGVKGFLHGSDPNATVHLDEPGLSVEVASPRYLFVMKAVAARVDRDAGDIRHLYGQCSFGSVQEALDFVQASVPGNLIPPKTQFLLEELLTDELYAPQPTIVPPSAPHVRDVSPRREACGHPLPRGGTCTQSSGHRGRHRRR